ncbi:MAG: hypothetical protein C0423_01830 [Methylibium sp.]|nr:hypothetical protein [Methylibium sp.]
MSKNMTSTQRLAGAAILTLVTACGGGGGDSSPTPTTPSGPSAADLALQTTVPSPTYALGSVELESLNYLNTRRAACGFGQLTQNASLDKSAAAHANYIIERWKAGQIGQYIGHTETQGLSGFTGTTISDRQKVAGYTSTSAAGFGGQILTMGGAADNRIEFIRALLAGPYHMIAALGSYRDVGLKFTETSTVDKPDYYPAFVIDMGYRSHPQRADSIRTFPCGSSIDVRTALGYETPNPVAAHGLNMTDVGPGLFVSGPFGKKLKVAAASIKPASGTGTEFTLGVNLLALDQDNDTYIRSWGADKMNEAVLVPHTKLQPLTRYTVTLVLRVGGIEQPAETFSFTTGQ